MAKEIERKFLVNEDWRAGAARGVVMRQGYLSVDPARVVRVRVAGPKAFLTVKGVTRGIERMEWEYAIPRADAEHMLRDLCLRPLVEKTRYRVRHRGRTWEVDVFHGDNEGLILAEVELPSATTRVALPLWLGRDVSDDPRYFNSNLARQPFNRWRDVDRA